MDIEIQTKMLRAKGVLNKINDTSYSYDQLNRNIRSQNINNNESADKVIKSYESLIRDLISFLKTTEYCH